MKRSRFTEEQIAFALRLVTDDARQPERTVEVAGYVLRDVEVDPQVLNFGVVRESETPVLELRVECPYGQALKLEKITVDPDGMAEVEAKRAEDRKDLILAQVRLKPSAKGLQKGTLKIEAMVGAEGHQAWVDCYALRR